MWSFLFIIYNLNIFNKGLMQLRRKDTHRFICGDSWLALNDRHPISMCLQATVCYRFSSLAWNSHKTESFIFFLNPSFFFL